MIIAGPCSVEDRNFVDIAVAVKRLGATHLRGGIFKPRSSPFRWHGIGEEAFEIVKEAKRLTGLPFVCEAMSGKQIEQLYDLVDVFQVGARNQQDTELLKEFGRQDKPVIMKRGMATTIEEFVMAADFIINEGNSNVTLCERGIRTFENYTRNTFDINCIASIKDLCNLPIIADASHGTGRRELVIPITLASLVAGASGFMVEVHQNPDQAMTDGVQSLTIEMFGQLMQKVHVLKAVLPEVLK
jgi:3-deoxy-7-phosphoheptulonate synthase